MGEGRRAEWVRLLGERLCLDLVNSANWIGGDVADEPFETADDVLAWLARALPLDPASLGRWRAVLRARPGASAALVGAMIETRAELRRFLLAGHSPGRSGQPGAAGRIERLPLARGAPPPLRLSRGGLAFDAPADPEGAWFRDMASRSALELALSPDGRALRRCDGERCGWLFLDRSRSRRRRWCSMEMCGNRAKTRAHYERRRGRSDGNGRPG